DSDTQPGLSTADFSTLPACDGSWSFTGLDASVSCKKILEVVPALFPYTTLFRSYTITGTSGTNQSNLNFENFQLFSVSGKKYTDHASEDVFTRDNTSSRIPTISIDKKTTPGLSAGDLSSVTASDGSWSFTGLDAS